MIPNFVVLWRAFIAAAFLFLFVGSYALVIDGRPRATGHLDLWVEPSPENARRIMRALVAFGAPVSEISETDFSTPGITYQIGVPPGRIDILTDLTALTFAEAWADHVRKPFGDLTVDVIGGTSFIRNKRATGRAKDLGDFEGL